MIKAIFFDIDGTLVSHTLSDIPDGVLNVFKELQKKGILLFIATGRHISEFNDLPLHDYPFDGYVTLTGQICYDKDFQVIYENPLSKEDTSKLVEAFNKKEIPIVLINNRELYINYVDDIVIQTQKSIHTPVPDIQTYQNEHLFGATVFSNSKEIEKLVNLLPGCKESRWNAYASDIVPAESGKVNGIEQMLNYFEIQREDIMAFGDADNDIDMINFAHIGVAIGNASDSLKVEADYITASVDKDGIIKALQHFHII